MVGFIQGLAATWLCWHSQNEWHELSQLRSERSIKVPTLIYCHLQVTGKPKQQQLTVRSHAVISISSNCFAMMTVVLSGYYRYYYYILPHQRLWTLYRQLQSFPVKAAHRWNCLPSHVTAATSLSIFCCRLKSHLTFLSRFLTLLSFVQYPCSDSSFWIL